MNASIERGDPPERALERDADELEHRLDRLGDNIGDARQQLKARREDADVDDDTTDDADEDDGEDPAAFDDPEVAELDEEEEE